MKRKNSKDSRLLPQAKRNKTDHRHLEKAIQEDMSQFEYIGSLYDKPDKVRIAPVDVLRSRDLHIKGLFATEDIPENTIIARYAGKIYHGETKKVLDVETGALDDEFNYHYTLTFDVKGNNVHIDSYKTGNYARAINCDPYQNNCIYDRLKKNERIHPAENDEHIIVVRTIKPVKKGEQFLAPYTDDFECEGKISLNPNDTDQSSNEYYRQHKDAYSFIELYEDTVFLVPKALAQLEKGKPYNKENLHLSILQYDTETEKPYEFSVYDRISLLMLACEKGNFSVVKKLIAAGVDVNQQQNQSGDCALNFAIEGYKFAVNKDDYANIIIYLIKHGAILHMRNSENLTFLHKAIHSLLPVSLERVLRAIPTQARRNFLERNNDDFVRYSLLHKKLDAFQTVLMFYPDYAFFVNKQNPEQRANLTPTELAELVRDYTPRMFDRLCSIMEENAFHKPGIEKLKYHYKHLQEKNLRSEPLQNPAQLHANLSFWEKEKSGYAQEKAPGAESGKINNPPIFITID